MGTVEGSGTYEYGATATLTAYANEGYHFTGWSNGETTAVITVTVTGDASYTANFEEDEPEMVTLTIDYDTAMGRVYVNGQLLEGNTYEGELGDQVILKAVALEGYEFTGWSNGETDALISVTLNAAISLTAHFAATEGIDAVAEGNAIIYTENSSIVVKGADRQTIRVFDAVGRLVAQRRDAAATETIQIANTGVYLVKVGDYAAKRVVIRR